MIRTTPSTCFFGIVGVPDGGKLQYDCDETGSFCTFSATLNNITINPDGTYTVRRSNGSTGGGTTKIEEGRLYWVGGGATGEWELSGHPPDEMILSRNTLSGNNAFGGYSNQVEVRYKRAK